MANFGRFEPMDKKGKIQLSTLIEIRGLIIKEENPMLTFVLMSWIVIIQNTILDDFWLNVDFNECSVFNIEI